MILSELNKAIQEKNPELVSDIIVDRYKELVDCENKFLEIEREIIDYKNKTNELTNDIARLKEELNIKPLEVDVESYDKEIERLSSELNKSQQEYLNIEVKNNEVQNKLNDCLKELNIKSEESELLNNKIDVLSQVAEERLKNLKSLEDELFITKTDLESMKEVQEYLNLYTELYEVAKEDKKELHSTNQRIEEELLKYKNLSDELSIKVSSLEMDLNKQKIEVVASSNNDSLKVMELDYKHKITNLIAKLNDKELDISNLQRNYNKLEIEKDSLSKKITQLEQTAKTNVSMSKQDQIVSFDKAITGLNHLIYIKEIQHVNYIGTLLRYFINYSKESNSNLPFKNPILLIYDELNDTKLKIYQTKQIIHLKEITYISYHKNLFVTENISNDVFKKLVELYNTDCIILLDRKRAVERSVLNSTKFFFAISTEQLATSLGYPLDKCIMNGPRNNGANIVIPQSENYLIRKSDNSNSEMLASFYMSLGLNSFINAVNR